MNLIARLWRGELSLNKVFFLWGGLGGLVLILPFLTVTLALTEPPEDGYIAEFLMGYLVFILIYLGWVFTGIWRSASRHEGDPSAAVVAKLSVGAGILVFVLMLAAILGADTG